MALFNRRKFKNLRQKLRRESTKSEDLLWYELNSKQLGYKFRRQQGIGNYIVDFYCPELKLVIEVDGISHDDEEVINKDKDRERYLEGQGLVVRRYSSDEIFESLEGVLLDIKGVCDRISGEKKVKWE